MGCNPPSGLLCIGETRNYTSDLNSSCSSCQKRCIANSACDRTAVCEDELCCCMQNLEFKFVEIDLPHGCGVPLDLNLTLHVHVGCIGLYKVSNAFLLVKVAKEPKLRKRFSQEEASFLYKKRSISRASCCRTQMPVDTSTVSVWLHEIWDVCLEFVQKANVSKPPLELFVTHSYWFEGCQSYTYTWTDPATAHRAKQPVQEIHVYHVTPPPTI